jgi:hypothetical protein
MDGVEYKAERYGSHESMQEALNKLSVDGWRVVGYQVTGSARAGVHYVVLERPAAGPRSEDRNAK